MNTQVIRLSVDEEEALYWLGKMHREWADRNDPRPWHRSLARELVMKDLGAKGFADMEQAAFMRGSMWKFRINPEGQAWLDARYAQVRA